MVLTGPAADEILELHFVRLMVSAGPASDRIFVLQIAKFVVLTGPAAGEILELHFARLMVFAGPAWACHRHNVGLPVCDSSGLCWACRCHGRNVLLVFELSCAQ